MPARTNLAPRFEGLLLDLFGTLIPTGDQVARAQNLEEMARALGTDADVFTQRWTESFDARAKGKLGSLEETIERLASDNGVRPDPAAVARALAVRMRFSRRLLAAIAPTILAALDAFRAVGVRLALVSDASEETVRLWPETALASRFDATVFSCLEGIRKPDPRVYGRALERIGLPAARCGYVGDGGSHELTGAEAVGLETYCYRFPGESEATAFRVEEDTEWRGTRLRDLRELLPLCSGSRRHATNRAKR
jgi:putative hydrolase of the HAD superfamily